MFGGAGSLEFIATSSDKVAYFRAFSLKILGFLHGSTNLTQVITIFLESLSWIDKALAVLQLIAAVLLLVATAGASLAAKILQLAVAIGLFIADIVSFIRALEKK